MLVISISLGRKLIKSFSIICPKPDESALKKISLIILSFGISSLAILLKEFSSITSWLFFRRINATLALKVLLLLCEDKNDKNWLYSRLSFIWRWLKNFKISILLNPWTFLDIKSAILMTLFFE